MTLPTRNGINALLLLTLLAAVSCHAQGAPGCPTGDAAATFDVTKYGAKANGKDDDATSFIRAWNDACKSSGPAKVVVPAGTYLVGEVIFQGPCSGPVRIEVEGTIVGLPDLSDYPNGQWFMFEDVDGLVLTGKGTFNAQGELSWTYDSCGIDDDACDSPLSVSFNFERVNNSIVEGITSINSKGFHIKVFDSHNFTVQNVNISAPGDSPHTDGIHVSSSDVVNISTCTIATGDDCVSIGDGSTNITVSNVVCGSGHGISIGSLGRLMDERDVRGVVVTNCTLSNTSNGVRIKTRHGLTQTQVSGILFQDIVMNAVRNPIIINQNFHPLSIIAPSHVKVSDVHFKNIKGTSLSDVAVLLDCSAAMPCEGIELVDIDFTFIGENPRNLALSSSCVNAKAIFSGKQNPPACPPACL